jgi:hypothetical protein
MGVGELTAEQAPPAEEEKNYWIFEIAVYI